MPKTIVVVGGPPGSGKGIQSTHISTALQIPVLCVATLLREALEEGTEVRSAVVAFHTYTVCLEGESTGEGSNVHRWDGQR